MTKISSRFELNEWLRIIQHESGHAAMALHLWNEAACMTIIRSKGAEGSLENSAKYGVRNFVLAVTPECPNPSNPPLLERIMILAAGPVIELIKYDDYGDGCASDFRKIGIFSNKADAEVLAEIESDYPKTKKAAQSLMGLADQIAETALESLGSLEFDSEEFEITLLEADCVRAIYGRYCGKK
jgi:hypothetical protein